MKKIGRESKKESHEWKSHGAMVDRKAPHKYSNIDSIYHD